MRNEPDQPPAVILYARSMMHLASHVRLEMEGSCVRNEACMMSLSIILRDDQKSTSVSEVFC